MEDEEEVQMQEPHFLVGSLRMGEKKIQEAMNTIHGMHDLLAKYVGAWRINILWRTRRKYRKQYPTPRVTF